MSRKSKGLDAEDLDSFKREKVKTIADLFPDERLRKFGLGAKERVFVRTYCVLLNAKKSATIAGYSESVAKNAFMILRGENVSKAIDAIMFEAVNPINERATIANASDAVNRLMSIIREGEARDAVNASKALLEYISLELSKKKDEYSEKNGVPESEIKRALERHGVYCDQRV